MAVRKVKKMYKLVKFQSKLKKPSALQARFTVSDERIAKVVSEMIAKEKRQGGLLSH